MIYYKIISGTDVIDATDNLVTVRYSTASKSVMRCNEREGPNGIISSDGQYIWHVEGWNEFGDGVKRDTVKLFEITESEYIQLREKLDESGKVPEPDNPETPENPDETVMTPVEMRVKIKELTATVDSLQTRNDFLEECLMEISEVVYA